MSKINLNGLTRTFNKAGMLIKKYSPEILLALGVTGTVASGILACKETLKVNEVLEGPREDISKIHDAKERLDAGEILELADGNQYTIDDYKKDLVITYVKSGLKVAKLYAPSIILAVSSLTAILASNGILRKRNIALAAAYATVDKGFKEYRSRVVDRFGDEVDRELKYNIKAKEFETITTDAKGKEKVEKEIVNIADPNEYSDYARFYDDGCAGWSKDPEANLYFLKCQQTYANNRLKAKGYLFLNEVYDMLGIPRSKAGQVVGWVYDEKNPIGDNFVDFGIYDMNREAVRNFVNGYERTILLDFNVDGNILEMM